MPRDLPDPFDDAATARDPDAIWARFEALMREDRAASPAAEAASPPPVAAKGPSASPCPALMDRPAAAPRADTRNAFVALASAALKETSPARTLSTAGLSTKRRVVEIGLAAALAAAATAAVFHLVSPAPVVAVRSPVAVTILGSAAPAAPAQAFAPSAQALLAPVAPFAPPLRVSAVAFDIVPPAAHRPAPPEGGVPTPRPATQSAALADRAAPDGA